MEFTKEEVRRFESKISKGDSCWEWIGTKFSTGYGMFCVSRKRESGTRRTYSSHRVSWSIHSGKEIPKGLWICHTCDNRICVNPNHLYLGTPRQNNLDTINRGRANRVMGSKCSWSKLSEDQVMLILNSDYGPGANKEFARLFGISQSQVSHIRHGRRWPRMQKHLQNG
jgi:hypothetical protein